MVCVSCKEGSYIRQGDKVACEICGDVWALWGKCGACGVECRLVLNRCEACEEKDYQARKEGGTP